MKTKIILVMVLVTMLLGFQCNVKADPPFHKKGMIKVSIFYRNGPGKTFDWNYYLPKHIALVKKVYGKALKGVTIDKGLSGRSSAEGPIYLAICHLYFDSVAAYQDPLKENGKKFAEDFPKYTNITPEVQISEVIQ
ncbi:EthD family reductase [Sphingobacterium siyangense]|uniref:EthD family reductase n=1 Tax=Sphingobacterium TaxID=28453 RepID=UPI0009FA5E68|nr:MULTISPECIES: EthD family reductase [Sphingobacterium]UQA76354.1 EthD family reductase [Sphingobacterium siyangense]